MTSTTAAYFCPKGHLSATEDYCSECGTKIQGAPATTGAGPSTPSSVGDVCPDCGTVREQTDIAFCEVCGFNFETGMHGEIGLMPSSQPELLASQVASTAPDTAPPVEVSARQQWKLVVSMDAALRQAENAEPLSTEEDLIFPLTQAVQLIGRKDESRGIFPDIAVPFDEAISRRHALLQADGNHSWLLRDIGSSNGTRLNGTELEPMQDYPLKSGDEITLGRWTCIRVEAE